MKTKNLENWTEVDLECPKCKKRIGIYIVSVDVSSPDKDFYCTNCNHEWDAATTAEVELLAGPTKADDITSELEPEKPKTSYFSGSSYSGSSYHGYTARPFCSVNHAPTKVINGENWSISVGEKFHCENRAGEFDVVMNLTGTSIKNKTAKHTIPIPELKKWEKMLPPGKDYVEMNMEWPDMGTIPAPIQFWKDLVGYLKTNKKTMLVFCMGGHGRTGTAVASLMVACDLFKPNEAIKWVRKNYCERAIETTKQENYILGLKS